MFFCKACRTFASAAAPAVRNINSPCKAIISMTSNNGPRKCAARMRTAARRGRCHQRPTGSRPDRQPGDRPRHRRPLWHHRSPPWTTRCTTPSASGRSPPRYTSLNQYHVVMEAAPSFIQGPDALRIPLRDRQERHADSPQRHRPLRPHHDLAGRQSQRAVSVNHDLLQPQSRRFAGRRGD